MSQTVRTGVTATIPGVGCPAPDSVLHGSLLGGNEAALADVHARHSSAVFNVALRVTGNRSAAEEVTQTVFLDLWRRPQRFDPARGSLRSWLTTVGRFRSVDWVRQETARSSRERRSFGSTVTHVPGVEETIAATIGAEQVRRALDDLSEKERTAIGLAYFGDRSYRQVASELGLAEGTVKSRIRAGLRRLAAALPPEMVSAAS